MYSQSLCKRLACNCPSINVWGLKKKVKLVHISLAWLSWKPRAEFLEVIILHTYNGRILLCVNLASIKLGWGSGRTMSSFEGSQLAILTVLAYSNVLTWKMEVVAPAPQAAHVRVCEATFPSTWPRWTLKRHHHFLPKKFSDCLDQCTFINVSLSMHLAHLHLHYLESDIFCLLSISREQGRDVAHIEIPIRQLSWDTWDWITIHKAT